MNYYTKSRVRTKFLPLFCGSSLLKELLGLIPRSCFHCTLPMPRIWQRLRPCASQSSLVEAQGAALMFTPERITRADVQAIMKKVAVRPNQDYTNQYPRKMLAKIVVRLEDGTTYENVVQDYASLAS
jgi:hypothetical protein